MSQHKCNIGVQMLYSQPAQYTNIQLYLIIINIDVDCQSREQTKKLTLTASSFFINHSSPWHIFHTDISEIMQSLNSWIIHAFMKQERNHRKVWETSFKNKVIPALILFLKTYMYRIPHNIHSIFIFMFIEKTLKIIVNINLHYFPPMCQWQKTKVTHEVMTNSRTRVAQWVRSLDLTTHTSLSPIRRGFAPGFVNYKKGAHDSQPQVIKFIPVACPGSLRVLRFPPPLKLVAMI